LGIATPAGTVDLTGSGVARGLGVGVRAGVLLGDGVGVAVAEGEGVTMGAVSPHAARHSRLTATHPNPSLERYEIAFLNGSIETNDAAADAHLTRTDNSRCLAPRAG
jgi:hypothetical protein